VLLLLFALMPLGALAQMVVTTGQTAQQLAEIIAGAGVTVSNASITGSAQAIGAFSTGANATGLNVPSGVLFGTGNVTDYSQNQMQFASSALGTPGIPYLANLAGITSLDGLILEFDFVPNADLVSFDYVFGSEEHPSFSCNPTFNDIFAITVQGVSVPLNETLITLVPGTSTPVSIGTVNNQGCGNQNYYVDNTVQNSPYVVFGGFTTVLRAETAVQCGETYRLKMMISDGGDSSYDTGCFVKENSLTTGNISVQTSTATGDNFVYEGCSEATVTITVNGPPLAQDFDIPIWISDASAQSGVDYTPLTVFNADSTVTMPAGQSSISFAITAINDNQAEQAEFIEFVFINSTCGTTDTFRIFIADLVPISVETSNDTTICIGNAITWAQGVGGGGLYTYQWDNNMGTSQNITPAPTVTTTYNVIVSDNCGSTPATADVVVSVDGGPSAFAGNDVEVCVGGSVLLNASSNTPGVSYAWTPATGLSDPNIANPMATTAVDQTYTLTVTRNDGCSNTDDVEVIITPPPTSDFLLPAFGCTGKPLIATYDGNANASAQFLWDFDGGTVTNGSGIGPIAVMWSQPGIYDVTLTVAWGGCVSTSATEQVEILSAPAVDAGPDFSICSGETVNIGSAPQQGIVYSWSPANALSSPATAMTDVVGVNGSHETVELPFILAANEQGCVSNDTMLLTVYAKPTAEFEIPAGLCFNVNSFSLEAGGYFGPDATFYWNFGPVGFPGSSTQQNPQGFIFNEPGIHDVRLAIADNGCLSDTFIAPIEVFEMPIADFAVDTNQGCEPFGVQFFDLSYNGNSPLYYQWQLGNGATSSSATPSWTYAQGVYDVRLQVTTTKGCSNTKNRTGYIISHPKPTAYFSLNASVLDILGPRVVATNQATGIESSLFIFDPFGVEVDAMQAIFEYPDTGIFPITQIVTTEFGCKDTLATTVEVKPHYTFYIPSAFTPNDNGINEVWAPHGENVMLYELRIFNRWNQQIFQSSDMETGWDGTFNGTPVPQGVYTYQIELYDTLGEPHEYVGRFTVMR
jgi:gliding motility-associated-like protein